MLVVPSVGHEDASITGNDYDQAKKVEYDSHDVCKKSFFW